MTATAAPPTASADGACEPYRELIALALAGGRHPMTIWRDLVDDHGFAAQDASERRFVVKLHRLCPVIQQGHGVLYRSAHVLLDDKGRPR